MKRFLNKLWQRLPGARRRHAVRPRTRNFRASVEVLETRDTPSVDLFGTANALTHSAEHYARMVSNAYQSYLHRPADQAALNCWVPAMQSGLTEQQFESTVLGSFEYYVRHGGAPDSFVTALYSDVLHRTPSAAEKTAWVNNLNAGMSDATVAWTIDTSFEANYVRAQSYYTTVLRRSPGTSEAVGWANNIGSGMDVNTALAYFIASGESTTASSPATGPG
jgi:hypothetical protein